MDYDSPSSRDSRRTVSASLLYGVDAHLQILAECAVHARPTDGPPLPDATAPAVLPPTIAAFLLFPVSDVFLLHYRRFQ